MQRRFLNQERAGFATIQQAELRTDLTYLSSDELQGRLSLQSGEEMAVKWIAEQFRAAGWKPDWPLSHAGHYFGSSLITRVSTVPGTNKIG